MRLEHLERGQPGISEAWGRFLAEASMYCLSSQGHASGVEMTISYLTPYVFNVYWEGQLTNQLLDAWADEQEATEYGACGIAILIILALTDYTVIRRSRKGTGIDYWLGYQDADYPFQDAARLEVSGIRRGNDRVVVARVGQKRRQTKPSDDVLPAYIVVVEFSRPYARMVKK